MATGQDQLLEVLRQVDADARPINAGMDLKRSVRGVELTVSSDLDAVRFEGEAVRKDYGIRQLGGGDTADNRIIAIGEHAYLADPLNPNDPDKVIQEPFRIWRNSAGFPVIQTWNGLTWETRAIGQTTIDDVPYMSWVSFRNFLLTADGVNPVMAWAYQPPQADFTDVFPVNNLVKIGDSAVVTVGNPTEAVIQYTVSYTVNVPTADRPNNPNAERNDFVVAVKVGNQKVAENTFSPPVGGQNYGQVELTFDGNLNVGQDVTLEYESIYLGYGAFRTFALVKGASPIPPGYDDVWVGKTDSGPNTIPANGPRGDYFVWDFTFDMNQGAEDVQLTYLVRPPGAANYQVVGTRTVSDSQAPVNPPFTGYVLGANWDVQDAWFAVGILYGNNGDQATQRPTPPAIKWWEGELDVQISGIDLSYTVVNTDPGSLYAQITTANFGVAAPVTAPIAQYLGGFGQRAFALWRNGNEQVLTASADGLPLNWEIDSGAVELELIDNRIDPKDPLIWLAPVSSQIAVLCRRRSMMRVFETGNPLLPVGATHWRDGVGSESPYGFAQVNSGIMFLGHDRMVYYMTADQLIPVGAAIQKELIKTLHGAYNAVQCAWDSAFEEFLLAIPENDNEHATVVYAFDLGRYLREQTMVWRRRYLDIRLIASVVDPLQLEGKAI